MCLIAIAHRASDRFPLVIAANRDEDYLRASHDAHFWADAPDVLGGRDAVAGGAWLALSRQGRFAAVTNLRGAERRARSRGGLVHGYMLASADPVSWTTDLAQDASEYSGFHLLAGEVEGDLVHLTHEGHRSTLPAGVHALSNAPLGEEWPKSAMAARAMTAALEIEDAALLVETLMAFLRTRRGTGSVESEAFIEGERYGTRASTVIVATRDELLFAEQSFGPGGRMEGAPREFRFRRG